jgi:hypothetical protein
MLKLYKQIKQIFEMEKTMNKIFTIFALLVLAMGTVENANADFNYSNFNSTSGLTMVGSTQQSNGTIILTDSGSQAGALWCTAQQSVQGGFETTFEFQGVGADGMAFVIQNSSEQALGSIGADLGYNFANNLAVEIDAYINPQFDPWYNHISIQSRGTNINSPDMTYSLGYADITQNGTMKISYIPGTMKVFVNNMVNPLLVASVDIGSLLNLNSGKAWVGFTGTTGESYDTHSISSWSFITPEPATLLVFGFGGIVLRRYRK